MSLAFDCIGSVNALIRITDTWIVLLENVMNNFSVSAYTLAQPSQENIWLAGSRALHLGTVTLWVSLWTNTKILVVKGKGKPCRKQIAPLSWHSSYGNGQKAAAAGCKDVSLKEYNWIKLAPSLVRWTNKHIGFRLLVLLQNHHKLSQKIIVIKRIRPVMCSKTC